MYLFKSVGVLIANALFYTCNNNGSLFSVGGGSIAPAPLETEGRAHSFDAVHILCWELSHLANLHISEDRQLWFLFDFFHDSWFYQFIYLTFKCKVKKNFTTKQEKLEKYLKKNLTMVHVGMKIKEILEQEKLDISLVAEKLGKSRQAVYDMLNKEDLNTSLLKQFSSIFNIPVAAFFDDGVLREVEEGNKLKEANDRIRELENEIIALKRGDVHASARVVVELNLTNDEFVKLGLKDKVIQVLNK